MIFIDPACSAFLAQWQQTAETRVATLRLAVGHERGSGGPSS